MKTTNYIQTDTLIIDSIWCHNEITAEIVLTPMKRTESIVHGEVKEHNYFNQNLYWSIEKYSFGKLNGEQKHYNKEGKIRDIITYDSGIKTNHITYEYGKEQYCFGKIIEGENKVLDTVYISDIETGELAPTLISTNEILKHGKWVCIQYNSEAQKTIIYEKGKIIKE